MYPGVLSPKYSLLCLLLVKNLPLVINTITSKLKDSKKGERIYAIFKCLSPVLIHFFTRNMLAFTFWDRKFTKNKNKNKYEIAYGTYIKW